ncbi:MAG: helix-turn-helix transcriptional regulator [Erysipelotrichaceae bacterium]|nr:helix-turn-helix transcriptional regulator [Erysipelotrichaceae bacterium]
MPRYAKDTLNELMKDPEFRKEWESMEPEFQIIKAMIDARNEKGITQKELSSITGITQGDISKLENGTANPSIRTLQRIAEGLGKNLVIEFK